MSSILAFDGVEFDSSEEALTFKFERLDDNRQFVVTIATDGVPEQTLNDVSIIYVLRAALNMALVLAGGKGLDGVTTVSVQPVGGFGASDTPAPQTN